jgi:hypothetical protein
LGGCAAEYSSTGHAVYGGMSLKIRDNLSMMSLSSSSPPASSTRRRRRCTRSPGSPEPSTAGSFAS